MNVSRWRKNFWLFAGVTLLGFAGWQVAQISVGRHGLLNLPTPKLPPTKVRSDSRVSLPPKLALSDPVRAYVEKAKAGMTDREIGWILEDFQQFDLDQTGHSTAPDHMLRNRQQDWYLLALTEGLGLSGEQKTQARTKMRELLNASPPTLTDDAPTEPPSLWLAEDPYQPWNLSSLGPEQEKITLKAWSSDLHLSNSSPLPIIQDPQTGNLTEFPDPHSPDQNHFQYLAGTQIFPLTPDQLAISEHLGDPLAQARLCHPSQLRIALLLQPTLAGGLLRQLNSHLAPGVVPELPLAPEEPPVVTEPELRSESSE